jgi:lipopolysaccharide/colanic/teichoic acid biosynthesis glycosyltransferase
VAETPSESTEPPRRVALRGRPGYFLAKRAFDLVAASLGLVVLSPLLLLAAIAIKLESGGPVFFLQQRVGRHFAPFYIRKFRTMVVDAEQRGGQLTAGSDPRITGVGRWLRKTKIDELPQLINIVRGDMSLVGPRPEVPRYVALLHDQYVDVLSVRPGLTDPSSIKYRDESDLLAASVDPEREYVERILPDKLAVSREYIARATMRSDLGVLFSTLARIAR